ncbi:uncharacterized protein LOC127806903 [Diospyros lotus]|uniref:uncharacterized protein LOC127806903 n=1 Tax=Diospyros lotus TaxID=55363 RepID=UPI0022511433|nr:uncharacterized protein LOC127806903 [Diospyros lotus]
MEEELQLQYKRVVQEAASLKDVTKGIYHPIIVAMKGPPCTERRLVALWLAASFRCFLLKEDDFHDCISTTQEFYHMVPQIVESQLQFGLSIIIDSELSDHSQFSQLKDVAKANETPLFIVECIIQTNELKLCRIQEEEKEDIVMAYDTGDIPKFTADITTTGDISKCVSELLQSFVAHFKPPDRSSKCNWHLVRFQDEQEKENCKQCQQSISAPSYRCKHCDLIFHKSCTDLPQEFSIDMDINNYVLSLRYADDDHNEDVRCSCCEQLIKGYYYDDCGMKFGQLDLDCIFLPFIRTTKFHEHPLILFFAREDYKCGACGIDSKKRPRYTCWICQYDKYITIDPHCALSPETAEYEGHRHPFELTVSPV